ncbi:hypothetical protein LCGC14_1346250 [marine sediment metagenome]|uniref:Uncharacterized protein n=1 Tax=marine sediment metagenome TaxID=412755 RepID=A0A0F9KCA5_9ZZZZ
MRPWCLYFALAGFAIWWALFTGVRRPAEVTYPRDEALTFSENN